MALKLSPEATEAIRNSLPAVAQGGVAVTTHFYGRMFANHPELKNVFNTTNQLGKRQQRALFHAIAAAGASAINDQGNYGLPQVVIDLIAHKHCALNITKDQYDIVGTELLGTIVDLLNPGQDILDGWAELYGKVAKVLYEREEELYQESESKTGGWRLKRDFIVQKRVQETKDVTSFYLVPKDGKEIASHLPGQYTTVWVRAPDWEYGQPRHYTLSDVSNGEYYRISVKKEGKVSDWLHDNAVEGSTLQLSPPYGLFTLTPESDKGDVILLSAGVGVTPVLSMLNSLLKKDEEKGLSRNVNWFHGASGKEYHSFREYVNGVQGRHGQFKATIYYSKPETEAVKGVDYHFEGRMNLADHRAEIEKPDAQYYFCGPRPWMVAVRKELTSWGVPQERLHYEVFGPALDDEEPEQ